MTSNTSLPRLAVLDDYANTSPEHLSHLSSRLSIEYFPSTLNSTIKTEFETLVSRLKPFTLISTMRERTPFTRDLLSSLPNLKVLLTTGMRNRGIDVAACHDLGIVVVGTQPQPPVPGFDTTNEQNWALILGLAKGIAEHDSIVKRESDGWQRTISLGLAGRTLACLGLGKLGLQCAVTGILGFGMNVIAWSANLTQEKADQAAESRGLDKGRIRVVGSKEELLRQADVLSLHVVLSERSRGIIGKEELGMMKRTAIMVNTSRGPLVDEDALLEVLKASKIRGYAADVFATEPLPRESEWRSDEWGKNGKSHVLLSPHMGYVEEAVLHGMYRQTVENLEEWLDGKEFTNRIHN